MINTTDKPHEATASTVRESRDQLIEDFKRAIEDAQELAEEAKNASGAAIQEKMVNVRNDLKKRMKAIRKVEGDVIDEVEKQAENLEDMIRENPWKSVVVATAVGVLADRLFFK